MSNNVDRLIYNLTKDWDDFNPKNVNVNISTSFLARARCKVCGKPPSIYYYSRVRGKFDNVNVIKDYSKVYQENTHSVNSDWFMHFTPKQFAKIGDLSADLHRAHFSIASFAKTLQGKNSKMIEYLTCECGETLWAFNLRSVKTRPDIINRKGRYNYPKKFEI